MPVRVAYGVVLDDDISAKLNSPTSFSLSASRSLFFLPKPSAELGLEPKPVGDSEVLWEDPEVQAERALRLARREEV